MARKDAEKRSRGKGDAGRCRVVKVMQRDEEQKW